VDDVRPIAAEIPNRRTSAGTADRARSALSHLARYSAARYAAEGLLLLRGLLLARILGPAAFGLWSQMKLALLFLPYTKLGTGEALLREVPFAEGGGDGVRAERIRRAVFAFDLLVSGLIAAGFVLGLLSLREGTGDVREAWFLLAVVFLASQLYWFAQVRLRAEKRFGQVGRIVAGAAFLSTVAGVPAAWRFGLRGFLIACALAYLVAVLPPLGGPWSFPRPRWDAPVVREMIGIGWPIALSSALLLLLWNVDKLAVWVLLPRASLGIYALGTYLSVPVLLVAEAVSVVLYPRLMERYGATGDPAALAGYVTRPTRLLAYWCAPLLAVLFLCVHLPIVWLLPRYAPAVVPARILIAALFFPLVARMSQVLLVAVNRQVSLARRVALSVVVAAAVAAVAILAGHGLVGAAAGATAGFITYSALVVTAAFRAVRMRPLHALRFVGSTLLPYAVTCAAVAVSIVLGPAAPDRFGSDVAATAVRCCIAIAPGALLLLAVHRPSGRSRDPQ
jgi:O-antigen/teichoic acid export membrane protein